MKVRKIKGFNDLDTIVKKNYRESRFVRNISIPVNSTYSPLPAANLTTYQVQPWHNVRMQYPRANIAH